VRDMVTNLLDTLGLLLLAAGAGAFAYRHIGWPALAVSGGVVLAGSAFAEWQARPPRPPKPAPR
jgi:hypothetical protein